MISCMPLNTENHVQSQDSPRGTCKLYSATGTNFSPTTLVYSRRTDFVEHVNYTVPLVQKYFSNYFGVQSQDRLRGTCKLYSATDTNFSATTLVYSRRTDFVEHVNFTVPLLQIFLQLLWCTVAGQTSWNM